MQTAVLEVYQLALFPTAAELGHPTTVHIAQGVTADQSGDLLLNELTEEPVWLTLRGHMLFWPRQRRSGR